MKNKKANGKYSTKTPKMQFLHKYTGAIILGFVAIMVIIGWNYIESEKVFFENWPCNSILGMTGVLELSDKELARYNEIILECDKFTPP